MNVAGEQLGEQIRWAVQSESGTPLDYEASTNNGLMKA